MKAILLSIKPEWAEKIYNGEKTIEWRKSRPKLDRNNHHTRVYIYETAPVKRITGYFTLFGTFAVDVNGMLKPPVSGGRGGMTFRFVREMLDDMEKNGRVPYCLDHFGLECPPQSWQYVEDLI